MLKAGKVCEQGPFLQVRVGHDGLTKGIESARSCGNPSIRIGLRTGKRMCLLHLCRRNTVIKIVTHHAERVEVGPEILAHIVRDALLGDVDGGEHRVI